MSVGVGDRRLVRSARSIARDPLIRNGHALNLSTAISSAVGLLFWIVAAHRYPAAVVGRNSAAISALTFFGGVAQLNLASSLVRYLPACVSQSRRLVIGTYAAASSVAVLLAIGFLALVPVLVPQLDFLTSSWILAGWFAVSTAVWAVFVLEDGALTGLRRASWIPVENGAFAGLKAAAVMPAASVIPGSGIFVAWTASTLATVLPTNRFLFRRALPEHLRRPTLRAPVTLRELFRYSSYDFVGAVFWLGGTSLLPLLVISKVGAGKSAAFQLAWVISYTLYLVSVNLGSSLVVETAHDQTTLRAEVRRVRIHLLKVLAPVVALTVLLAPAILRLFGPSYAHEGPTALRLLVLSAIPFVVSATTVSACRSLERTRIGCVINAALFAGVSVLSWVLLPHLGITAVGLAWLVTQLAVCAVVLFGERRWLAGRGSSEPRIGLLTAVKLALARMLARAPGGGPLNRFGQRGDRRRAGRQGGQGGLSPALLADVLGRDPSGLDVEIRPSASDRTVAVVRGPDGAAVSVIKVPRSGPAVDELLTELEVVQVIRAEPRLKGLRRSLPVMRIENSGGHMVAVERPFAGLDAAQILQSSPGAAGPLSELALGFIGEFHRRTGRTETIEETTLTQWIGEDLVVLAETYPGRRGVPKAHRDAVEGLAQRLRAELVGRRAQVSWIHGDFTPGNVVVCDGAISGVVDWAQARPNCASALDVALWHYSLEWELAKVPIGRLVRRDLQRTPAHEPAASSGLDLGDHGLVLWCWLRHVAGTIAKAPRYAEKPLWWTTNVEAVLRQLGPASGPARAGSDYCQTRT